MHIFGSIFSLKLSLKKETVLNSLNTLKRYCKAALNVFFNKKKLMMTKKYLNDRFFVSNQSFTTKRVKLFKIPVLSRFPGKVATLYILLTT